MSAFLQQFHFLRPEWLLAFIPLVVLLVLLILIRGRRSGWQQVIPAHLYKHMVSGNTLKQTRPPFGLLAVGWAVAVLALAGPTWERLPQPVFQLKRGHVVVMDMSLSMRATDVSPDRLTRARYKAIDLLNALGEGETGLVAYAGDAFVISPLTEDVSNITALLPSLRPEIMPVAGSDPLLGFQSAAELLENAGYQRGDIFWITDGIEMAQQAELQEYVRSLPYRVNVLAVGTEDGAPIRQLDGELLKDASGSIVIPRMRAGQLRSISSAGSGGFALLKADDSDINRLAKLSLTQRDAREQAQDSPSPQGDAWREAGPYLLLMLLPLAAYGFRRGLLFAFLCACLLPLTPSQVQAQQQATATDEMAYQGPAWWQQPFMNKDQEAKQAFDNHQYQQASQQFSDPAWQGAAHYRAGEYAAALDAYRQLDTTDALYNQGNALAKLGKLDEAIETYQEVLERDSEHQDAAANKALLERLKEQQNSQNDQQQQGDNGQSTSDNQQQQEGDDQQQNAQSKQSESDQSQQSDAQNPAQDNPPPSDNADADNNQQGESQSGAEATPPENEPNSQPSSAQQQPEQPQSEAEDDTPQPAPADRSESDAGEQASEERQAAGISNTELTDEEREEQQRLENLLRRVPDDPAYLLKRKMQLEAQKRQRQRLPANRRDW